MLIRKIEKDDIPSLASLHYNCYLETYHDLLPENYLNELSIEKQLNTFNRMNLLDYTYVVESKERLLGYVIAARREDRDLDRMDYGEIQAIYVLNNYQKIGYGGMLLDYATAALEQKHFKYIVVWVLKDHTNAVDFFRSQGYEEDGKEKEVVYQGSKFKAVRMQRKIHHYIVEEEE